MTLTDLETGKQETVMSAAKICISLKGLIVHSQLQRRKNPPAFSRDCLASVQKVFLEACDDGLKVLLELIKSSPNFLV